MWLCETHRTGRDCRNGHGQYLHKGSASTCTTDANRSKISASTGTSMTVPKSEDGVGQQQTANDWHLYRRKSKCVKSLVKLRTRQHTLSLVAVKKIKLAALLCCCNCQFVHHAERVICEKIDGECVESSMSSRCGSRIPGKRYTW